MKASLLITALIVNAALVGILVYQVFLTDNYPSARFWLLTALLLSVFIFVPSFVAFATNVDRIDGDGKRVHRRNSNRQLR